jgi:uncharacterized protein
MKKLYGMIFAVLMFCAPVVKAETAGTAALAEELLSLMDVQKNVEDAFAAIRQMQASQIKSMGAPDAEQAANSQNNIMDMIAKEMSWDKLKADYIRIYAETFTESELKGLIDFYRGPVGKKFIEKSPELMKKSMEISQKQMQEIMPKIQQLMMQEMQKKQQAPAAPAAP